MKSLYQVGPFTDVARVWGERLWSLLNEKEIIETLKNTSDGGRPAVEGIAVELHQRFGEQVRQDRVKQFIGFLVRQVMEINGYIHDSYGHQTQENPVFTKGSRYVRRRN